MPPLTPPSISRSDDKSFNVDRLAADFDRFLEKVRAGKLPPAVGGKTDLYSLFVELSALKNEVKLESRWVKSTFDKFGETISHWREAQEKLSRELDRHQQNLAEYRRQVLKSMLMDWLEQRDRMAESALRIEQLAPQGWRARFRKGYARTLQTLAEGQRMALRRLDERLAAYDVHPIPVLGLPLDPYSMRAVETANLPDRDDGTVVEELRRGFLWEGELLRYADVKVNKLNA